eukprot:CAMPEP_0198232342 /NCGR_PEP_ID=MMETSP1445-20131203/115679_1 /TAXON_ID=36898 /ORGANISM="Pyramimonas sp., Strain CCMP2087" /LENGTH=464 /DNA_ID=CAMNT_0043913007 /DNA_START=172 /DNA_END=1563 /DNA_ORIENTATION=+
MAVIMHDIIDLCSSGEEEEVEIIEQSHERVVPGSDAVSLATTADEPDGVERLSCKAKIETIDADAVGGQLSTHLSRAPNRELALPSKRCLDSPTDDKTQSPRQRLRSEEQVTVRTSSPGGPSCSAQDGGPSCSAQDDITQLVADQEGQEEWKVSCICGARADDGALMIACDECSTWEHTLCNHIIGTEMPSIWYCTSCRDVSRKGAPKLSKRGVTGVSIKRHSRKVTQEAEAQGWSRLKQKDWVACCHCSKWRCVPHAVFQEEVAKEESGVASTWQCSHSAPWREDVSCLVPSDWLKEGEEDPEGGVPKIPPGFQREVVIRKWCFEPGQHVAERTNEKMGKSDRDVYYLLDDRFTLRSLKGSNHDTVESLLASRQDLREKGITLADFSWSSPKRLPGDVRTNKMTKMVKLMRFAPSIHTPSAPLVQSADADTLSLQGDTGSGLGEGPAAMDQEGEDATMAPSLL